jgi:hypothetical protein
MATYIWSATSAGLASTASNWTPTGVPGTGDTASFDGTSSERCTWDIFNIGEIKHEGTNLLIFNGTDVSINGLQINSNSLISVTSATELAFSGTAPYKSSSCYILIGATESPYDNATSRGNLTFKIAATGTIYFDCGEYPILDLSSGTYTPEYVVPSVTNATDVKILQLIVRSGVTFAPTINPSAESRNKKWITEGSSQNQFVCSATSFDGGYATWTFQATSSGFYVPVSGNVAAYSGTFSFHKMVIGNLNGVGTWATIGPATRLILNDLTVETGVSLKADDTTGSAIMLVNRPTIKGTWGFIPIADGYYVYPETGDVLGFSSGGTGLTSLGTANQVLATNATANGIEWQTVSGGGSVSSVFGRTGAVVATEGDYDLDELGDVDVTSAVETQILRHDGTSFVNDYNDIFFLRVKAREAISKGEAVYIFDAHNANVVGVKKARADSSTTMPCIGIAYETLALGDEGLIVAFGKANGIAANFTEGETMYVSPTTAGALTNTKPTGNTHLIQNVGILMKAHASNASVKVTGVGRTNDVPNQFSVTGSITASALVTSGGTVNDFVKGDGSLDSTPYLTSESDPVVGAINGIVKADGLGTISPAVPGVDYVQTETDPIATPLANANTSLINTNTNLINDITTKARVYAFMGANQNYSSGSLKVAHDQILYDTGGDYDPVQNEFIAPRDGFYLVTASWYAGVASTWALSLIFIDTGAGYNTYILRRLSGNGQDNMLSSVVFLQAGNKIAHFAGASGAVTIQASLNSLTYFTITELV